MNKVTNLEELEANIKKEVAEKFGNNLRINCVPCEDTDPKECGIMVTIVDYTSSNEGKYENWYDDVDIASGDDPCGCEYIIVECFISIYEWNSRNG